MIEQIRRRRLAEPFVSILVRTDRGEEYPVPTRDHVSVNPNRTDAVIFFEDETHVTLPGRRIAEIVDQPIP